MHAPLTKDQLDAIAAAPREETNAALAARLGLSSTVVGEKRAQMRREDVEAARAIRAEHARKHTRSALEHLSEALECAREDYLDDRTHTRLRVWLQAIELQIARVAPDPASLTDDELLLEAQGIANRLLAVQVNVNLPGAGPVEALPGMPVLLPSNED